MIKPRQQGREATRATAPQETVLSEKKTNYHFIFLIHSFIKQNKSRIGIKCMLGGEKRRLYSLKMDSAIVANVLPAKNKKLDTFVEACDLS